MSALPQIEKLEPEMKSVREIVVRSRPHRFPIQYVKELFTQLRVLGARMRPSFAKPLPPKEGVGNAGRR
jgi:hypothetical protein